jgi:DNA-binding PucR family transcriptional regulator
MAAEPTWREVLLTAGAELGLDAVAAIATDALAAELPLLRDDPDLLEAARASSAANLALLLGVVHDQSSVAELEPPPAAIAFARELARRNTPVAELGRAYAVAQRALWRWALAEVHRRIERPAAVAEAVEALSEATFATGDVLTTMVLERYAVEREQWLRSAAAVRSETVQELLAGGPVDAEAAGRRLRYELRRSHQAFVAWGEAEDAAPEAAAAAVGGDRALLIPLGAGLTAGWAPAGALRLDAAVGGAGVAVGAPGEGAAGFRRSHAEAMEARRVARATGRGPGVVAYDDVALLALLTKDAERARAFAERTLGPLTGEDATSRRLARTLLVVLEEQGSPRRAGARLGVHENTVAKRLRAVDDLLDPATRGGPAELLAALAIVGATRGDAAR